MHFRGWPIVVALLLSACAGGGDRIGPGDPTAPNTGTCAIPPRTFADLAACNGTSEQIELEIAESFEGKTTAKIAITSKDPQAILAGMGGYAAEWSTGADSFTVFAYGSANDYASGAGYNRGRIFWNNGGPITVDICTTISDLGGIDFCETETTYTVTNR